jgi:hypothetical protein
MLVEGRLPLAVFHTLVLGFHYHDHVKKLLIVVESMCHQLDGSLLFSPLGNSSRLLASVDTSSRE